MQLLIYPLPGAALDFVVMVKYASVVPVPDTRNVGPCVCLEGKSNYLCNNCCIVRCQNPVCLFTSVIAICTLTSS